jgi:hypothetical protein
MQVDVGELPDDEVEPVGLVELGDLLFELEVLEYLPLTQRQGRAFHPLPHHASAKKSQSPARRDANSVSADSYPKNTCFGKVCSLGVRHWYSGFPRASFERFSGQVRFF